MMKASENARYYGLDKRETQAEYEWHLNDFTNNRMAADGFFYQVVPVSDEHAYVPKKGVDFASVMVPPGVRGYGDAVAENLNWLQSEGHAGRNSAVPGDELHRLVVVGVWAGSRSFESLFEHWSLHVGSVR